MFRRVNFDQKPNKCNKGQYKFFWEEVIPCVIKATFSGERKFPLGQNDPNTTWGLITEKADLWLHNMFSLNSERVLLLFFLFCCSSFVYAHAVSIFTFSFTAMTLFISMKTLTNMCHCLQVGRIQSMFFSLSCMTNNQEGTQNVNRCAIFTGKTIFRLLSLLLFRISVVLDSVSFTFSSFLSTIQIHVNGNRLRLRM